MPLPTANISARQERLKGRPEQADFMDQQVFTAPDKFMQRDRELKTALEEYHPSMVTLDTTLMTSDEVLAAALKVIFPPDLASCTHSSEQTDFGEFVSIDLPEQNPQGGMKQ